MTLVAALSSQQYSTCKRSLNKPSKCSAASALTRITLASLQAPLCAVVDRLQFLATDCAGCRLVFARSIVYRSEFGQQLTLAKSAAYLVLVVSANRDCLMNGS